MQKLLNWLDKHLVEAGVALLLVFIPLYPKLPLIDILQTWVYIRIEDFVVAAVVGVWLVQVIRRRFSPKVPLALPIIIYWLVGGISLLFALIFLRKQMIDFFPHLAVLHYLRRIEYLVVFFIAATSIKNLKTVKKYLLVTAVTLLAVCFYGFGQKLLGWPAFLTMNEEFAKGLPLVLGPAARMSSTFAGHYDLAAYLVLMIALFSSLIFGLKKRGLKIATFILVFLSFLLLLLSGSRISFAVYLVAISGVLFLHHKKQLIIPVILISLVLMNLVSQVSGRFGKTFRVEDVVYDVRTGKPIAAVEKEVIEEELPLGTGFIGLPTIGIAPEATKQAIIRRSLRTATMSAEIATISGEFLIKRAIVYDISFTTRFQGTWPRAIKAFRRNRFLGSGYSSIDIGTDNSYLRALGETGALGLIAFLGLFFSFGLLIKQGLREITSPFGRSILIGMAAGVFGLLLNAVLIDVFEASKVAFVLWLLLGITAGMVNYYLPKRRPLIKEVIEVIQLPFIPFVVLGAMAFLVFLPSIGNYFVGDDFVWLRWAYKTWIRETPQFFFDAQGFFYRPLAKTYFVIVKPFFDLRPGGYHLVDFLFHAGSVLGAYFLTLRLTKKKLVAFFTSLLFLIHPINAESVLWISSTSALFASFFFVWGVLAYSQWRASKKQWRAIFYVATILAFIFGLVSHERMITFPLLLLWYDLVLRKFKPSENWLKRIKTHLPFWFLIAAYLWLRNVVAQAHGLRGDYNYNLRLLPFNFAGNLFGYLGELIASFHFIPWYDLTRSTLRTNKPIAFGLLIIALAIISALLVIKKRKQWQFSKTTIFAAGWFIILLLPFLGFGNIAERHVYPAHLGFFILVGLLLNWVYQKLKKRQGRLGLWLAIAIITGIFGFYLLEMEKAKREWHQAGEATNTILLALSSNYIEFAPGHSLYFVNPPIRFNRAWVFPNGLKEGIWLIYRDEGLPIEIATDLEETLDLTEGDPYAHVFVYEDNQLKEVSR